MHLLTRHAPLFFLLALVAEGSAIAAEPGPPVVFGSAADQSQVIAVSMVYLLANPTILNGKRVRVSGVLRFQFESDALYLDRESYNRAVSENAIGLALQETGEHLNLRRDRQEELSGRFATVEGIFTGSPPQAPCGGKAPCVVARRGFDIVLRDVSYLEVRPARDGL